MQTGAFFAKSIFKQTNYIIFPYNSLPEILTHFLFVILFLEEKKLILIVFCEFFFVKWQFVSFVCAPFLYFSNFSILKVTSINNRLIITLQFLQHYAEECVNWNLQGNHKLWII